MPIHTGLVSEPDITRLVDFVTQMTATGDGVFAGMPALVLDPLARLSQRVSLQVPCCLCAGLRPSLVLACALSHLGTALSAAC